MSVCGVQLTVVILGNHTVTIYSYILDIHHWKKLDPRWVTSVAESWPKLPPTFITNYISSLIITIVKTVSHCGNVAL